MGGRTEQARVAHIDNGWRRTAAGGAESQAGSLCHGCGAPATSQSATRPPRRGSRPGRSHDLGTSGPDAAQDGQQCRVACTAPSFLRRGGFPPRTGRGRMGSASAGTIQATMRSSGRSTAPGPWRTRVVVAEGAGGYPFPRRTLVQSASGPNEHIPAIRTLHYSRRTEQAYVDWLRRFILFHNSVVQKAVHIAGIRAGLTKRVQARRLRPQPHGDHATAEGPGTRAREEQHCRMDARADTSGHPALPQMQEAGPNAPPDLGRGSRRQRRPSDLLGHQLMPSAPPPSPTPFHLGYARADPAPIARRDHLFGTFQQPLTPRQVTDTALPAPPARPKPQPHAPAAAAATRPGCQSPWAPILVAIASGLPTAKTVIELTVLAPPPSNKSIQADGRPSGRSDAP